MSCLPVPCHVHTSQITLWRVTSLVTPTLHQSSLVSTDRPNGATSPAFTYQVPAGPLPERPHRAQHGPYRDCAVLAQSQRLERRPHHNTIHSALDHNRTRRFSPSALNGQHQLHQSLRSLSLPDWSVRSATNHIALEGGNK